MKNYRTCLILALVIGICFCFSESALAGKWAIVKIHVDLDFDGNSDWVFNYINDEYGNLERIRKDLNRDGIIDSIEYYTNDTSGYLVEKTFDFDNDGTMDRCEYYTNNAQGNPVEIRIDNCIDEQIEFYQQYIYDSGGALTDIVLKDSKGDTVFRERYINDGDGKKLRSELDLDDDGTIDSITYFSYDAEGDLIKDEEDFDNDGDIDSINTYIYTAGNNRLNWVASDTDADGNTDKSTSYTWQYYEDPITPPIDPGAGGDSSSGGCFISTMVIN